MTVATFTATRPPADPYTTLLDATEHQRRLIEWWLYMHSEHPDPARVLAAHKYTPITPTRPALTEPDPGPTLYDTGLDAREGLWLRQGWAGRG